MISAKEARQNVINKEITDYHVVEKKVTDFLNDMDASIQFHSRNGITEIEFTPYANSRFPSIRYKELAKEIFDRILKQNGYIIAVNNIEINVLKVQW